VSVHESEIVYDYCWYPMFNAHDRATAVFLTASRDKPLHLWDAFTGGVHCIALHWTACRATHTPVD
jgi:hypothetical protein